MTTRRFAIVGDPVGHTASPRMHAAAYATCGLDCTYEAIRATEADLPRIVDRLRAGDLAGVNVTIPHKKSILACVDVVDPSAQRADAANTLVRTSDGRVVAHNTDVLAIWGELHELAGRSRVSPESWIDARALVLGTGATARSAIVALAYHLGTAEITVRGRSLADEVPREAFRRELHALLARGESRSVIRLEPWGAVPSTDRELGTIVQATSVGMEGAEPGDVAASAVAWGMVPRDALVLDVVYGKEETPFVHAARARDLRAAGGGGMLARQGALAFELWFSRPAPLAAMRAALAA